MAGSANRNAGLRKLGPRGEPPSTKGLVEAPSYPLHGLSLGFGALTSQADLVKALVTGQREGTDEEILTALYGNTSAMATPGRPLTIDGLQYALQTFSANRVLANQFRLGGAASAWGGGAGVSLDLGTLPEAHARLAAGALFRFAETMGTEHEMLYGQGPAIDRASYSNDGLQGPTLVWRGPGAAVASAIVVDPNQSPEEFGNQLFRQLVQAYNHPSFHDAIKFDGPLMPVADTILQSFANTTAALLWTPDFEQSTPHRELEYSLALRNAIHLDGSEVVNAASFESGMDSLIRAQMRGERAADVVDFTAALLQGNGQGWALPRNDTEVWQRVHALSPLTVQLDNGSTALYPNPPVYTGSSGTSDTTTIAIGAGVIGGVAVAFMAALAYGFRHRILERLGVRPHETPAAALPGANSNAEASESTLVGVEQPGDIELQSLTAGAGQVPQSPPPAYFGFRRGSASTVSSLSDDGDLPPRDWQLHQSQ